MQLRILPNARQPRLANGLTRSTTPAIQELWERSTRDAAFVAQRGCCTVLVLQEITAYAVVNVMLRPAKFNNGVGQYYLVMGCPEALVFELPTVPIRTMR